jgi:hypothetical protein
MKKASVRISSLWLRFEPVTSWNMKQEWNSLDHYFSLFLKYKVLSNIIQKDLLKLNRDQLRWLVGLFTGHCHLKGHLFKLRLTDDPTCERCLEEAESATHVLCDCEAIAHLRFHHLGQFFMEPSDFYDAPISKVLHFIGCVGLIKG